MHVGALVGLAAALDSGALRRLTLQDWQGRSGLAATLTVLLRQWQQQQQLVRTSTEQGCQYSTFTGALRYAHMRLLHVLVQYNLDHFTPTPPPALALTLAPAPSLSSSSRISGMGNDCGRADPRSLAMLVVTSYIRDQSSVLASSSFSSASAVAAVAPSDLALIAASMSNSSCSGAVDTTSHARPTRMEVLLVLRRIGFWRGARLLDCLPLTGSSSLAAGCSAVTTAAVSASATAPAPATAGCNTPKTSPGDEATVEGDRTGSVGDSGSSSSTMQLQCFRQAGLHNVGELAASWHRVLSHWQALSLPSPSSSSSSRAAPNRDPSADQMDDSSCNQEATVNPSSQVLKQHQNLTTLLSSKISMVSDFQSVLFDFASQQGLFGSAGGSRSDQVSGAAPMESSLTRRDEDILLTKFSDHWRRLLLTALRRPAGQVQTAQLPAVSNIVSKEEAGKKGGAESALLHLRSSVRGLSVALQSLFATEYLQSSAAWGAGGSSCGGGGGEGGLGRAAATISASVAASAARTGSRPIAANTAAMQGDGGRSGRIVPLPTATTRWHCGLDEQGVLLGVRIEQRLDIVRNRLAALGLTQPTRQRGTAGIGSKGGSAHVYHPAMTRADLPRHTGSNWAAYASGVSPNVILESGEALDQAFAALSIFQLPESAEEESNGCEPMSGDTTTLEQSRTGEIGEEQLLRSLQDQWRAHGGKFLQQLHTLRRVCLELASLLSLVSAEHMLFVAVCSLQGLLVAASGMNWVKEAQRNCSRLQHSGSPEHAGCAQSRAIIEVTALVDEASKYELPIL